MKNIQLYILVLVMLSVLSCQKKHDIEYYNLGAEFDVSALYTDLDGSVEVSINDLKKNLSQISVTHLGWVMDDGKEGVKFDAPKEDLGSFEINNGKGSIVFTREQLGVQNIKDYANLRFNSSFDGKAFHRDYTIELKKALSNKLSGDLVEFKETNDTIWFKAKTGGADISDIDVSMSVNSGAHVAVELDKKEIEKNSLNAYYILKTEDYNYKDSISFSYKVTAGELQSIDTVEVHVLGKDFDLSSSGLLSSAEDNKSAYLYTKEAGIEIKYKEGGDFFGFESTNATFLKVGDNDKVGDFSAAYHFMASGSPVSEYDKVAKGDVFAFKFTYKSKDYYGALKIDKVDIKALGASEDMFEFTDNFTYKGDTEKTEK